MKHVKLIFVEAGNNHNKFYNMVENDDDTFTATWGRVGSKSDSKIYDMSDWDKKYHEKVKKGYTDNTDLFVESASGVQFRNIQDSDVTEFISSLQRFSNTSVEQNYTVSSESVTLKQIETAQSIIDALAKIKGKKIKPDNVNPKLIDLFKVIPRRMAHVQDNLIADGLKRKEYLEKINSEQETLDVMRGQVNLNSLQVANTDANKTILDAMGIEIKFVDKKSEENYIKSLMGKNENQFVRAFKINHKKTRDSLIKFTKNNAYRDLWHGSRNENWWSILDGGLVLRPANATINGKMFGYGLYFADKAQKSIGYTSLSGSYWANGNNKKAYLALFNVALGNCYHTKEHKNWMCDLNYDNLREKGDYDSLFAEGGIDLRNNEYIIYKENQCTMGYMIEIKGAL